MADIASQSWALNDGWGYGYRPVSPGSPRYTVSKSIKDNGNGTATVSLTCTITTNAGYIYPNYILYLNLNVAGVTNQVTFKPQTTYWYSGNTYSATVSVTIPLDGTTTRSANLWVTGTAGTAFTFASNTQGGDSITGIPLGYQVASFTAFSDFYTTDGSIAVTIRERTASLVNRVTLKIGNTTIKTWTNVNDADSLALVSADRVAMHNALPSSVSATATMVVESLNGTTVIGSVSRTATVRVPASVVPSFTSLGASEQASGVAAVVGAGNYVQNRSLIRFTFNSPAAGEGASIASYRVEFSGEAQNKNAADFTPKSSGSIKAKGILTDSRGRTVTKESVALNVLPYSKPYLSNIQIRRATGTGGVVSDTGTYLRLDRSGGVSPLTVGGVQKNSMTLKIETKAVGTTTWSQVYSNTWASNSSLSGMTVVSPTTYSVEKSYNVRITLTDKFDSVVVEGLLKSASFPLIFGVNNVGVGKVPAMGVLDVGGDLYSDGFIFGKKETIYKAAVDANLITEEWILGQNGSNFPDAGFWYVNTVYYSRSSGNMKQIAYAYQGSAVYTRYKYGGAWSGWSKLYSDENTAVLENTTNGVCQAVRWPNGWQQLTWRRTLSTAISQPTGVMYFSNASMPRQNWPYAFSAQPVMAVLAQGGGQVIWYGVPWGGTPTLSPEVYLYKASSDSTVRSYVIEVSAMGRWA